MWGMAGTIDRIADALSRAKRFVAFDIWDIGHPGEAVPNSFLAKQARVLVLLVQKFVQDQLIVRAAALSFATALAIVPVLAFVFIIITSFNLGENVYAYLGDRLNATLDDVSNTWTRIMPGGDEEEEADPAAGTETAAAPAAQSKEELAEANREAFRKLLSTLLQGVGDTNGESDAVDVVGWIEQQAEKSAANPGAVGLAGLVFFLATSFGLMRNIEQAFMSIWGAKRKSSWFRTLSDYLAVTLLLPVVALGVIGISAALASSTVTERLGPLAAVFQSLRFVLIWFAFASLYAVVPHTRVKWRYAVVGGVVAGTAWVLLSMAYVNFQIGAANYSLVWSTFAQVPVLLMWVYASWIVVLFGAELTYAYQHERTFAMERWAHQASYAYREAVGLRAMLEMGWRFEQGMAPLEPHKAAEEWNVPTRLLNETLHALKDGGLVTECAGEPATFQPGRSLDRVGIDEILRVLREAGKEPSALREEPVYREFLDTLHGAHRLTLADAVRDRRLLLAPAADGAE